MKASYFLSQKSVKKILKHRIKNILSLFIWNKYLYSKIYPIPLKIFCLTISEQNIMLHMQLYMKMKDKWSLWQLFLSGRFLIITKTIKLRRLRMMWLWHRHFMGKLIHKLWQRKKLYCWHLVETYME